MFWDSMFRGILQPSFQRRIEKKEDGVEKLRVVVVEGRGERESCGTLVAMDRRYTKLGVIEKISGLRSVFLVLLRTFLMPSIPLLPFRTSNQRKGKRRTMRKAVVRRLEPFSKGYRRSAKPNLLLIYDCFWGLLCFIARSQWKKERQPIYKWVQLLSLGSEMTKSRRLSGSCILPPHHTAIVFLGLTYIKQAILSVISSKGEKTKTASSNLPGWTMVLAFGGRWK